VAGVIGWPARGRRRRTVRVDEARSALARGRNAERCRGGTPGIGHAVDAAECRATGLTRAATAGGTDAAQRARRA
jgi:hypothetical protein